MRCGTRLRNCARDSVNLRVSLDSALDRDPGFDSLARVELLVRIEHAFGVQLPDTVLESAETCRDLLAALQVTPCDDASEQTISYGQLWQQARAVAGGLQRRGLQPGQTVALMLPFWTAGI